MAPHRQYLLRNDFLTCDFSSISSQVVLSRVSPQIVGFFLYTQATALPTPLSPEEYSKMNAPDVRALCGYNEDDLKTFEKEVLDRHNFYRRRHNNYPLKFSKVCIVNLKSLS